TPGKQALGIRVIQTSGTAVSFTQAAVRNLLRVVDGLPLLIPDLVPVAYGVGFLAAACDRESRRLGDLAAGTLVVYVEGRACVLGVGVGGGGRRRVARAAGWWRRGGAAGVRPALAPPARRRGPAMRGLCLRREERRVRGRVRLFPAVAEYFKARLGIGPMEYE